MPQSNRQSPTTEKGAVPGKLWTWRRILWHTASGIFWVMVIVFVALLVGFDPGPVLASAIVALVILVLVILGNRFEVIHRTLLTLLPILGVGAFALAFWVFYIFLPLILFSLFYLLSDFMQVRALRYHIIVLSAWGLFLAYVLLLMATESRREHLFNKLRKIGPFAPVIYSLNALVVAVAFFSSMTYVLAVHTPLKLSPPQVTLEALMAFYLWHFLEAIPLLEVNDTLGWKRPPLTYNSAYMGSILLLFKLTVIVPVIAAFAGYWGKRRRRIEKG